MGTGLGALMLLLFSGCESVVKVPLNEHSHIHIQADPTDSDSTFAISYHLYEDYRSEYRRLHPGSPINIRDQVDWRDWEADFSIDGLGTAYGKSDRRAQAIQKLGSAERRRWHPSLGKYKAPDERWYRGGQITETRADLKRAFCGQRNTGSARPAGSVRVCSCDATGLVSRASLEFTGCMPFDSKFYQIHNAACCARLKQKQPIHPPA